MEARLTAIGLGGGVIGFVNDFAISVLNVPVNTILLAAAGALLSHAYNEEEVPLPRKKFYIGLFANTTTACTIVSILPAAGGWEWYSVKMEGALAFLFAMSARFAIPLVFKMMPEIVRRWFKIGEYKNEGRQEMEFSDWDGTNRSNRSSSDYRGE